MKKVFLSAVAIFLIILGGYFVSKVYISSSKTANQQPAAVQESENISDPNAISEKDESSQPDFEVKIEIKKNEVAYTDSGYMPSELTIKTGETVTFKNESSGPIWTASALHPSHAVYAGTSVQEHCPDTLNASFDQCGSSQPGESWSFTFNKAGEWSYHNHVKLNRFGKIIVQ